MDRRNLHSPATAFPQAYVFQEYPKWVVGQVVQNAAEEAALLAKCAQADGGGAADGGDVPSNETLDAPTREGDASTASEPDPQPSRAALRMRRTRERRRAGRRLVRIELSSQDIAALVTTGHLAEAEQHTSAAIGRAVETLLATPGSLPRRA